MLMLQVKKGVPALGRREIALELQSNWAFQSVLGISISTMGAKQAALRKVWWNPSSDQAHAVALSGMVFPVVNRGVCRVVRSPDG